VPCAVPAHAWALRWCFSPKTLAGALTFCDITTSPDGKPVRVDRRLAEIHDRYGPGHLVSRSIRHATPMILHAVDQVVSNTSGQRVYAQLSVPT
jgi:hypothetical protein